MIWLLLIVMQFKHLIADYILQGKYMLGKFKSQGWELPLAAHCSIHLLFTFLIALSFGSSLQIAFKLCLLDFTIHFIMDMIKANPNILGRFKPFSKKEFEDHEVDLYTINSQINVYKNVEGQESLLKYWTDLLQDAKQQWKIKEKQNRYFWLSLGVDQMVHHLTDLAIVYLIINTLGA